MRAKIHGKEGAEHIPTLQKWKGLESLMREIDRQKQKSDKEILSSLASHPAFSILYTAKELKQLLKMTRFMIHRDLIDRFLKNLKELQTKYSYQEIWPEITGLSEADDYHLIKKQNVLNELHPHLTLGDLATADSRLYVYVNSMLLIELKLASLPHLLDRINDTPLEILCTDQTLLKVYTKKELEQIYKTPEAFNQLPLDRDPVATWNNALDRSDRAIKANMIRELMRRTCPDENTYEHEFTAHKASEAWHEFSPPLIEQFNVMSPQLMIKDAPRFDPEKTAPETMIVNGNFLGDLGRVRKEIKFHLPDQPTITIPEVLVDESDVTANEERQKLRYQSFVQTMQALQQRVGDTSHSLVQNIQYTLQQDFRTAINRPMKGLIQTHETLYEYNTSLEDETYEFQVIDDKRIHMVYTQPGHFEKVQSIANGGGMTTIGSFSYTIELDHVKDEKTGQWKIANVKMTECAVKLD